MESRDAPRLWVAHEDGHAVGHPDPDRDADPTRLAHLAHDAVCLPAFRVFGEDDPRAVHLLYLHDLRDAQLIEELARTLFRISRGKRVRETGLPEDRRTKKRNGHGDG